MDFLPEFLTFLTDEEIRELPKWQYQGSAPTLMDKMMDPWWSFCERLTPRWLTANSVTLLGIIIMLSITLFIALFGSVFGEDKTIPALLTLFAFFANQTLDAVDGKHARALGLTSPFGSMLDHGCDAFAMFLQSMLIMFIVNTDLDDSSIAFFIPFVFSHSGFYLVTWAHHFEGKLLVEGVTENQFLAMILATPNIFYGKEFWTFPAVRYGFFTIVMTCVTVMGFTAVIRVFRQFGMRVLPLLLPIVCIKILAGYMYFSGIFQANPLVTLSCIGMTFTLLSLRLVMGNMVANARDPLAAMMVPVLMLFCATVFPSLLGVLLVIEVAALLYVGCMTTIRVCNALEIPIFFVDIKQK